jgi:uncharacterized membrane protein YhfC
LINSILFYTYPLGIIAVLVIVFGLGVFLTRKYNLGWRLYWIGAVLFIVSKFLNILFNLVVDWLFRQGVLPTPSENYQLLFSAVFLGLSAGLFEELIRYAGLRWWAKDARTWAKGLLFGSGWGGMEALIFFVLAMALNYIFFLALLTQDLSALIPAEQMAPMQEALDVFWGVNWYDSLLGVLERFLVIPIHICLTILVLQVFLRGQNRWLWFAVAWHALLDAMAVISVRLWGAYLTEGIVAVFTLLSLGIIFALQGEEPQETEEHIVSEGQLDADELELPPIEENLENIGDSRYTE